MLSLFARARQQLIEDIHNQGPEEGDYNVPKVEVSEQNPTTYTSETQKPEPKKKGKKQKLKRRQRGRPKEDPANKLKGSVKWWSPKGDPIHKYKEWQPTREQWQ